MVSQVKPWGCSCARQSDDTSLSLWRLTYGSAGDTSALLTKISQSTPLPSWVFTWHCCASLSRGNNSFITSEIIVLSVCLVNISPLHRYVSYTTYFVWGSTRRIEKINGETAVVLVHCSTLTKKKKREHFLLWQQLSWREKMTSLSKYPNQSTQGYALRLHLKINLLCEHTAAKEIQTEDDPRAHKHNLWNSRWIRPKSRRWLCTYEPLSH